MERNSGGLSPPSAAIRSQRAIASAKNGGEVCDVVMKGFPLTGDLEEIRGTYIPQWLVDEMAGKIRALLDANVSARDLANAIAARFPPVTRHHRNPSRDASAHEMPPAVPPESR